MDKLNDILSTPSHAEKWVTNCWQELSGDEKSQVSARLDNLFAEGLPFKIEHDKHLYLYVFSMFMQLEALGTSIYIKANSKISDPQINQQLRAQIVDEVFHILVFAKITRMLCKPYMTPPNFDSCIKPFYDEITKEECPKILLMFATQCEIRIETAFRCLHDKGIATKVFATLIADEQKHISDSVYFAKIGLPHKKDAKDKLKYLDGVTKAITRFKFLIPFVTLLGVSETVRYFHVVDEKIKEKLAELNLTPTPLWMTFCSLVHDYLPQILKVMQSDNTIDKSPTRKMLMSQWENPKDPTMVGEFKINISCLDFFNKKYPKETLTTLMLQAISLGLIENESFRVRLQYSRLFVSDDAYIALAVKLPHCGDHIGSIVLKNCHEMSVATLAARIQQNIKMMSYCYQQCQQLEAKFPHLKDIVDGTLLDITNEIIPYPIAGNAMVSVSSIGYCGYSAAKSPLFPNEAMKFTLLKVEKQPVWNNELQQFAPQDILPVSISADHRIYDGNLAIPHMTEQCFNKVFTKMKDEAHNITSQHVDDSLMLKAMEKLLSQDIELGYRLLFILQNMWFDFIDFKTILTSIKSEVETDFV